MTTTGLTNDVSLDVVADLAAQLRVDSIRSSTSAGSGHPTSSMSAADLLAVLVTRHLRYDWDEPRAPANDHLIFSKGHASPLLYSVFKAVGVVSEEELLNGYRRFGQRLEGHPTPVLPWVDVATGSLGQGLPDGVGVALAGPVPGPASLPGLGAVRGQRARRGLHLGGARQGLLLQAVQPDRHPRRQPARPAGRHRPRLGHGRLRRAGHGLRRPHHRDRRARPQRYRPRPRRGRQPRGRGQADGHHRQDDQGQGLLRGRGQPRLARQAVPAGHGGPGHRRARRRAQPGAPRSAPRTRPTPGPALEHPSTLPQQPGDHPQPSKDWPEYKTGEKVATRKAYGDALVALGARDDKVVALDGEVSNSTYAFEFARAFPERYFEMFIAEQQMVAAATGLAVRGYKAFASTFAAFLTRAYDFIRMGAISGVDLRLVGSHAGVEIGADGPSQMALEDLAMMRAVHGSTVLYPADGTSTAALVAAMADTPGISYMRTTRGSYPGLYGDGEAFPVGGSKTLRSTAGRPGDADRRRGDAARVPARRGPARRGRHRGPRHRLLLGQADRHRGPDGRGDRTPPGGSWSPRTTTRRAASARRSPTPCSTPGSATSGSPGSPSARCPAPGPAKSCWPGPAIDAEHIADAARQLTSAP